MNTSMTDQEEKKVVIEPLPETAPAKKKLGRPRTRPPRVESHAFTPGRQEALKKARAVKVVRKMEAEKKKKEEEMYQKNLMAPGTVNSGVHYNPTPDLNASLRQSDPTRDVNAGREEPYYPPNSTGLGMDDSQIKRMERVEVLLSQLLKTEALVPQNITTREEPRLEQHKTRLFKSNPWRR